MKHLKKNAESQQKCPQEVRYQCDSLDCGCLGANRQGQNPPLIREGTLSD